MSLSMFLALTALIVIALIITSITYAILFRYFMKKASEMQKQMFIDIEEYEQSEPIDSDPNILRY